MDLRSLIEKLDTLEQTQLLTESQELIERVGLRLQDIEQAVGREIDPNKRATIIGDFARKFGYAGLFDPVSGKFVNKDGKFASFGAYQSEVEQLEDEGLIPNSAKTDALLGFMGKDEKQAKPSAFARADLFGAIDKADGLLDKALAESIDTSGTMLEGKSITNALLAEFGINTTILEAITPEEHQFLKKTVKDAESIKHKADAIALITRYNKEYIPARDRLIARIKEIIATIKKPTTAPATAPAAPAAAPERKGSSANESLENTDSEMLLELSLTPQGQKAGAKLFEPDWKGYLNPQQVQHNLNLLKKGHAKLDWSDHVGKTVKDWANMATFDIADKAAAYMSSVGDKNTSYEKERAKQKATDQAYNQDPNALNLRTASNAVGYKIDPNNPVGNMTLGDVLGLVGPGAVSTMFTTGTKVAKKLGGGKVAQFVTGTGAVVATQKAADQIGKVPEKDTPAGPTTDVATQPATAENLKYDPEVKKIQDYLVGVYKSVKNILPRFGADGKLGKETIAAFERAKKEGKLTPDGKIPGNTTADTRLPNGANGAHADATNAADTRLPNGANGAHADATNAADPATATNASAALDPKVVQDALTKLGVSGNQISPEQLLSLADSLGIKDDAEVASADTGNGSTSSSSGSSANSMMGQYPSSNTSTSAGSSSGGIVQGTTATAESLDRILALSGLKEDENLEEGGFDRVAGWVIDQMIAKGMSREASLAKLVPNASNKALHAEIKGAKAIAARIEAQGRNAERAVANTADDAARVAPNAERAAASAERVAPNAERAAVSATDNAVSRLTADAAKGEGLLYKVGKLGGRFVRLIKNNKFLSLLAALAALGIGLYIANRPEPEPGPVNPQPVVPGPDGKCPAGYKLSKDGKTCEKETGPAPGPGEDEENKRKLAELEKLLAQLYGGWPTDPETAETIKAGVGAGAKAPEGFKEGGVATQPAGGAPAGGGNDRVFGRAGVTSSAEDLAKKSSEAPTLPGQGVRRPNAGN